MQYLHTMIRVNDLDESVRFYTDVMGMRVVHRQDYPSGEFTLVFLSFGDTKRDPCVELTYNWGKSKYELGDAYGHMAYGVDDIHATCATIKSKGGKVTREPGPMKHGGSQIAFIEDPNGYKIELIQL